jgi:hypothetical protein
MLAFRKIAVFVLALNLPPALGGPFEDADLAERRDDFATAIPIYRSLAAKGVVEADKRLGKFYMVWTACWKRRGMLSTYWSLKPGHRIRMLMVKCSVLDSQ